MTTTIDKTTAFLLFLFIAFFTLTRAQVGETSPAVAQAIQELKTVDIYYGFTAHESANTNYTRTLCFSPVDWGNSSYVVVSLIRLVLEQTGAPTHYLWVNYTPCNTPSISAVIGRSQYVADFDCTNIINHTGCFNVTHMSTLAVDNVHNRVWITYVTDLTNQTIATQKQLVEVINFFDYTSVDKTILNHDFCLVNTTQRKLRVVEKCGIIFNTTTCIYLNTTEDTVCNYGCDFDTGECKKPPYMSYLVVFFIVVGFIILLLVVLKLTGRI